MRVSALHRGNVHAPRPACPGLDLGSGDFFRAISEVDELIDLALRRTTVDSEKKV